MTANETPQERAARLMREIDEASKAAYTKGEVKAILNNLAQMQGPPPEDAPDLGCRSPAKVDALRRGDVFIAKAIGGKVRPWIVLRIGEKTVSAVAMSSGDKAPAMVLSRCRYWPGNWIGTTLSLFAIEVATQEVTRPYTDDRHLREIEAHVAATHGLAVAHEPLTLGSIRERLRA